MPSELTQKIDMALKRIETFQRPEGLYLAFSGGKDSVVTKRLLDMAGAKYDAHYRVTSVDPPELVRFVIRQFEAVIYDLPDGSFKYFAVNGGNAVNVSGIAGVNTVLGQHSRIPGRDHVIRGHGGAVGPLGGRLDGDRRFGQVVVPDDIAVSQQRIQAAVQHVVHIQGFEHDRPGAAGSRRARHRVVHVGADGVPANDGAPLLAAEVDGLVAGQVFGFFCSGNRDQAQRHRKSQNQC